MSSPVFRSPAGSPPAPASAVLPNPRKRPSMPGAGGPNANAKRRKASTYSAAGSNHPLRQTSFPPEEAGRDGLRSPSVESDMTASQSIAASGMSGKRGRKRKSAAPDTMSMRSGKMGAGGGRRADASSQANGAGGGGNNADEGGYEEGDEGEGDGDEDVGEASLVEGRRQGADEERRRYAVLFEAADEEQQERMAFYKRYHLNDAKLRRIVNQTLSQSVPKSVITAINSYAKVWLGGLIERALEVQREEIRAQRQYLTPEEDEANGLDGTRMAERMEGDDGKKRRIEEDRGLEEDIGPLLPDSLREALRRHKRDGEAGGVGVEGTSLGLGMQGARASASNGKRLFR